MPRFENPTAHGGYTNPCSREELVADAAEAFWSYVVQREQFGLMDPEYIAAEYAIPTEVQRAMGPNPRTRP